MTFTPNSPAVVVLRRGDRVLITMAEDPTPEDAQDYLRGLTSSFPGVDFVLLGNVAGVMVQPGDARPESTPG